jgi:preprotein translocase subunit SecD
MPRLEVFAVAELGRAYGSAGEALAAKGVTSEKELAPGTSLIFWPAEEWRNGVDQYYLATTPPALTGGMLKDAWYDTETGSGFYRISMEFGDEGAKVFAQVTKKMVETKASTGIAQRLVIVLDGVVYSAPAVYDEIQDGKAEITGVFTEREAKELVAVLQSDAMPLDLVRVK